ncbi:conserved hypothetical protein [Perkinsus marinus ATCC 50983]|uniref:Uncharacterized protein n=1 Tax=Perkinsus marinus (strain ATCC 50983 / TXsc) TaxID=423536 RepID=C5LJJ6_PERM5|nr:conserved hypothetical protein [Perkinsus marinus ATCC 50983]EER03125.1 conserved hypothetical protein [Perkinsus marinus ATCC 50983]|eukprot:XP_002771309.1 conserved hypothetical protein [Perkinsus marinus ATCC 50983]
MTWLILFGLFTGRSVVLDTATKTEVAYPFVGATFAAGIVAGLLGIGGGMMLGPLMLNLGVLPQANLHSDNSNSDFVHFLISGIGLHYGRTRPMELRSAFIGTLVCQTIIDSIVKQHGLTSLLVLLLATMIAFAAIMVTVAGLIKYL